MRVRAAGALLLAVPLAIIYSVLAQPTSNRFGLREQLEALFWVRFEGDTRQEVLAVVRDGLLLVVVIVAILGIAGLAVSRFLIPVVSAALIVLYVPWVIWDPIDIRATDRAPEWIRDNYPWYLTGRWAALLVMAVLFIAALVAVTDRNPARPGVVRYAPGSAPGPAPGPSRPRSGEHGPSGPASGEPGPSGPWSGEPGAQPPGPRPPQPAPAQPQPSPQPAGPSPDQDQTVVQPVADRPDRPDPGPERPPERGAGPF